MQGQYDIEISTHLDRGNIIFYRILKTYTNLLTTLIGTHQL